MHSTLWRWGIIITLYTIRRRSSHSLRQICGSKSMAWDVLTNSLHSHSILLLLTGHYGRWIWCGTFKPLASTVTSSLLKCVGLVHISPFGSPKAAHQGVIACAEYRVRAWECENPNVARMFVGRHNNLSITILLMSSVTVVKLYYIFCCCALKREPYGCFNFSPLDNNRK